MNKKTTTDNIVVVTPSPPQVKNLTSTGFFKHNPLPRLTSSDQSTSINQTILSSRGPKSPQSSVFRMNNQTPSFNKTRNRSIYTPLFQEMASSSTV